MRMRADGSAPPSVIHLIRLRINKGGMRLVLANRSPQMTDQVMKSRRPSSISYMCFNNLKAATFLLRTWSSLAPLWIDSICGAVTGKCQIDIKAQEYTAVLCSIHTILNGQHAMYKGNRTMRTDLSSLMVEKHYGLDECMTDALGDILCMFPLDKTSRDYKMEDDD